MTQTFARLEQLPQSAGRQPMYLAIGSFDGVHLGHQDVIKQMTAAARTAGARAAVLTLFPHPKRVINDLQGRYYITTLEERVRLLAEQGLDLVITHPFDEELRHMRANAFIDLLLTYIDMRQIWGGGFSLGFQREGDEQFLRRMGTQRGFEVVHVDDSTVWNGEIVSSSRIRRALQASAIEEARGCLGRPYVLTGHVIKGDQRGQKIGFPTANLDLWDELLLPADGVYATRAWIDGASHAAATNVGVRPTVDGRVRLVEAHLLDFEGDLYGQEMRLEFISNVRPEKKFDGLDALQAQIAADVLEIRQRLLPDGARS